MLLTITLATFSLFTVFQILYIFIPLYSVRKIENIYPLKEKGISVLIPAYNEMLIIDYCLDGVLHTDYQDAEFLIINDGSSDGTMEVLTKRLSLKKMPRQKLGLIPHERVHEVYQSENYPQIWVIDKENGGKADALNAGIDYAEKEIIITLDADSILDPNALREMNRTFSDDSIIAAGGLVNIVQEFNQAGKSFSPKFKMAGLIKFQVVRYLTGFYMNKTTQSKVGSLIIIAGAFGAFRKDILLQTKGYRKTVGEDMDITLRIQELIGTVMKDKRIVFVREAVCYTEWPASLSSLYKQRIRWQKAFIDCVIMYRKSYYRKMNFRVSTFLLIDSLILGTLSAYPILLIPIIILLSLAHIKLLLLLFSISFTLAMLLNLATMIVSRRAGHLYSRRDYISIILFLPFEVLFYRMTEVIFVTFGTILYFFNKDGWSRADRIGKSIEDEERVK